MIAVNVAERLSKDSSRMAAASFGDNLKTF
jgi:hypothetical protein